MDLKNSLMNQCVFSLLGLLQQEETNHSRGRAFQNTLRTGKDPEKEYEELLSQAIIDLSFLKSDEKAITLKACYKWLDIDNLGQKKPYPVNERRSEPDVKSALQRRDILSHYSRAIGDILLNVPDLHEVLSKASPALFVPLHRAMLECKPGGFIVHPTRINLVSAKGHIEFQNLPDLLAAQQRAKQKDLEDLFQAMKEIESVNMNSEKELKAETLFVDTSGKAFCLRTERQHPSVGEYYVQGRSISEEMAVLWLAAKKPAVWNESQLKEQFTARKVDWVLKALPVLLNTKINDKPLKVILAKRDHAVVKDFSSSKRHKVMTLQELKRHPHRSKLFTGTKSECQKWIDDGPEEAARLKVEEWAELRHKERVPLPSETSKKTDEIKDGVRKIMDKLGVGEQINLFDNHLGFSKGKNLER